MKRKHRNLFIDNSKIDVFERMMKILISMGIGFTAEHSLNGMNIISFECDDNFYSRLINNSDFKGTNCAFEDKEDFCEE